MAFLDDLLRGAQETAARAYNQANPFDGGKNWNTPVARPAQRPQQRPQQQRPQPQYSPQVQQRLAQQDMALKQSQAAVLNPMNVLGDISRAAQTAGQGLQGVVTGTINGLGNRVADFGEAGAEVIREATGQNQAAFEQQNKMAAEYRRMAAGFAQRAQQERDPARRQAYIDQINSLAMAESDLMGTQAQDLTRGLNATDPRKTLTNAAETALDVVTAGRGATLMKGLQPAATQVTGQALKQLGVNTARVGGEGAGLGAAYGGINTARDANATLQDYARNMGTGAAIGAAAGVGAQAALPVAGAAIRGGANQVRKGVELHNSLTPQQRQGGFIAGPKALGFKDAEAQGKVFDGVDGAKRFEVSDENATISNTKGKTLAEVLNHPALFENYPQLKDVKVKFTDIKNAEGRFDPKTNTLTINPNRDVRKQLGTILHESQHKIQSIESFAGGGSAFGDLTSIKNPRLEAIEKQSAALQEQLTGATPEQRQAIIAQMNKLDSESFGISMQGSFDNYRRLAGEAEARAVEARMNMTEGERYIKGKDASEYAMSHRPNEDGPQAHAMDNGDWFGKDYYDKPEWYGANLRDAADKESFEALKKIRGNPDAEVTIYRAGPKNEFNNGDWVSLSKKYAEMEAQTEGVPVHSLKVKAKDVRNAGDSINEFGYYPTNNVRSTFYDSLDVPKDELIVRRDGGVAMSVEPKTANTKPKKALPQAQSQEPSITKFQKSSKQSSSITQLNTNRLGLTDEAKTRLATETSTVIDRLTNQEVKDMAQSAGIDFKSYGVAGTKKKIAEQLNLRNEIATVEEKIKVARAAGNKDEVVNLMKQSADLGRLSREQGTDLGRQLAARRIIADQLATPQQKLFRLFDEAGVDPDAYTKRLADVDMNNADAVIKAYRELVPPKFADWLDKYRYTNMLSAPLTHIVNLASNAQGLAGIAPAQKLYEGTVDAVRAGITGGPRTRYASEAGSYYKGAAKAVPEAMQRFADVVTGKQMMDMPDADALKYGKLAHGGIKGAADNVLSVIPKFLEASDQMFMALARGGERASLAKRQSKGVDIKGDIEGKIDDSAKYRVFRQDLGKEGQGTLLEMIDFIPNQLLLAGRRSKNPVVSTITKFTVPFVTTPVNLFKQGIEYSPAGVLTLAGNADKTAQVAKALMGTTAITVAAAALASDDRITFNEPSDPKQRDAFRAEGKQPYAVKIGDKWFGYSKLHPAIAFNLAVVAATKQGLDMGAIDQPTSDKILNAAGGVMGYFRDQSYMKGVGDFTSNLELKDGASMEDAIASMGGSWANQLVPFKGMVSWIGRQIDPTQRKIDYAAGAPEQIYQSMVKDIPGLNKNVPVRENPYYKDSVEPIMNDNPTLNAFSPVRVTNDKGYGNTTGLNITERRDMVKLTNEEKPGFRQDAINEKYAKKQEEKAEKKTSETKKAGGNIEVAPNLDKKTKDILTKYDSLDEAGRDKEIRSRPEAEFEFAAAKYFNDKAKGKISEVEDIKMQTKLAKLQAGSTYSKDVRELYELNKTQMTAYINEGKLTKDKAKQIMEYGDKLTDAGLISKNKFRDTYGNESMTLKAKKVSSGRKSSGRKATGKGGRGGKSTLPTSTVTASLVSFSKSANNAAKNAKVAKKQLPTGTIRRPGIKAYKKTAKTNVSMTRKA